MQFPDGTWRINNTVAGFLLATMLSACSSSPVAPWSRDGPALALLPAQNAGLSDQRGRFREITCAVLAARAETLPHHRDCEEALTRLDDEPPGPGTPVALGPARRQLTAALVPGVGWECIEAWLGSVGTARTHLAQFGYGATVLRVDGLSGSDNNARQIRDEILARSKDLPPASLVLIGYSKGAPDILTAVVEYPEIRPYVAAVVSIAGAVGGSPLANVYDQDQLDLMRHAPDAECSAGDGQAMASMRPATRRAWLQQHPLPPELPYYSLVTLPEPQRISSVLQPTYRKLSRIDPRNDGQVIFYDQVVPGSSLLAYLNADHWAVTVPIAENHPFIGRHFVDQNDYPRAGIVEALMRFIEEDLDRRAALSDNPPAPRSP